jgi:membrane-associated phospholipid phosphatase
LAAKRPFRAASLAAAGTSLLFIVCYSATNALAASTAAAGDELGTFYWEWERYIPLVPWMIIPYMSIDAFFVAAPFVCTDVREIKMLAKRLSTAVIVACLCFLIWPLALWFERPEVDGFFGPIFGFLHGFDQPHNLIPSLHITLIFILRWTYHRHVRGAWRVLMHVWFLLVTLSTILTHQHQVIDLITGLVLAILIFYAFPTGLITRTDATVEKPPSPRLASRYGGGALSLMLIAWGATYVSWTVFWLLVWAALALLLVCAGYAFLGPRVFRKYAGYLSIPATILLAPYLWVLWLTRKHYWKQEPRPWAEAGKNGNAVLFGRLPDKAQAQALRDAGVTAVLDLCAEHSEQALLRQLRYKNLPVMDLAMPEPPTVDQGVQFIEAEQERGGKVYVHCGLGYERSGVVVAAWLLKTGQEENVDAAVAAVRTARSARIPDQSLRAALAR